MQKSVDVLLEDIGDQTGLSFAGDRSFLNRLAKVDLVHPFLDDFCEKLLQSVERRSAHPMDDLGVSMLGNDARELGSAKNFLLSLRDMVFDRVTKSEVQQPSTVAFAHLYQVGAYFSKFGADTLTRTMLASAVDSFLRIEEELESLSFSMGPALALASEEIRRVCKYMLPTKGRHGPGVVAEGRLSSGGKYDFIWPSYLDPMDFAPLQSLTSSELELNSPSSRVGQSNLVGRTSRLVVVPKNRLKGRTIAAEPALLQYIQQGYGMSLSLACVLTPGCPIRLRRQDVSANLAKESSAHGYYSTLDLSAASDRIHLELVRMLFPPDVFSKFAACRSEYTELPDGHVVPLRKFASMGNALTFPVQSLIFWALAVAHMRLAGVSAEIARSECTVYGDDIILPSSYSSEYAVLLTSLGLKVNEEKSFQSGSFRESCGMHAYYGVDVTPVYCRTDGEGPEELVSRVALANGLLSRGYRKAGRLQVAAIEGTLNATMPFTPHGHGFSLSAHTELMFRNELNKVDEPSLANLIELNRERRLKVWMSRTDFQTYTHGLAFKEIKATRRQNSASGWFAIKDLTDRESLWDRGIITGRCALVRVPVRLSSYGL